jgi:hypothetical protein
MDDKKAKSLKQEAVALSPNKLVSTGVPFLKNQTQIEVHRFRLKPANMLKNTQWDQKQRPRLEPQLHGHWFYTKDRRGQEMTKCYFVGGHCHEVRVFWKEEKGIKVVDRVEVGPALRQGTKTLKTGKKIKTLIPIAWLDDSQVNAENDEAIEHLDDHTHDVAYIGMDIMSLGGQTNLSSQAPRSYGNTGINIQES